MGYMERFKASPQQRAERRLRNLLALFPDRATYEQWLTARNVGDEERAHMERFLPAQLRPQGTV